MFGLNTSILIVAAGYGLAAGVAFLVYLTWFKSIQTNNPNGWVRWGKYFLLSLAFSILGRVTGISVALGVLPMLVLASLIPPGRMKVMALCSFAYACLFGGVFYMELEKAVTPRELTPEQIEWLDILLEDLPLSDDALKAKEYLDAHGIDPNKYFVANGIDPATTFDSVEELKIGDLTLKIPIPNGLTREEQYAPSEDNPQYCSIFKGDNGLSLIVTFQCMRKPPFGKRGMESLRLINLYIYSSSDVYSPLIKKNMNDLGLTFTNMSTPVTLQNTKDSTCFCIRTKCVPVDAKLNDKEISEKAMNYDIYVGSILIRGTLLSFAAHEFYHTSSIQRPLFINWFQQIITSNQ